MEALIPAARPDTVSGRVRVVVFFRRVLQAKRRQSTRVTNLVGAARATGLCQRAASVLRVIDRCRSIDLTERKKIAAGMLNDVS